MQREHDGAGGDEFVQRVAEAARAADVLRNDWLLWLHTSLDPFTAEAAATHIQAIVRKRHTGRPAAANKGRRVQQQGRGSGRRRRRLHMHYSRQAAGAAFSRWAMAARASVERNRRLQAINAEVSCASPATVRSATGRWFGTTPEVVRGELYAAFCGTGCDNMLSGAGLPWPMAPLRGGQRSRNGSTHGSTQQHDAGWLGRIKTWQEWAEQASDSDHGSHVDALEEGYSGNGCPLAVLVPHGRLGGVSGSMAAFAYRAMWNTSVNIGGFPRIVILLGTTEPWLHPDEDGIWSGHGGLELAL
jgi:hypothetical protein